jgi:hypothetical protein
MLGRRRGASLDPVVFFVRLGSDEWNGNLGAWHCTALGIPSAKVTEIRSDGKQLADEQYSVDREGNLIIWRGSEHPGAISVRIKTDGTLLTADAAVKATIWAAVVTCIATVAAAIITGVFGLHNEPPSHQPVLSGSAAAVVAPTTPAQSGIPNLLAHEGAWQFQWSGEGWGGRFDFAPDGGVTVTNSVLSKKSGVGNVAASTQVPIWETVHKGSYAWKEDRVVIQNVLIKAAKFEGATKPILVRISGSLEPVPALAGTIRYEPEKRDESVHGGEGKLAMVNGKWFAF